MGELRGVLTPIGGLRGSLSAQGGLRAVLSRSEGPHWEWKTVSGSIVSISDALAKNAQSLSVTMTPVQDLHGYDNPWPAGGGKNKFDQDTVMPSLGFIQQSDGSWFVNSSSSVANKTIWSNTEEISGSISLTYTYKYNSSTAQGVRFRFEYSNGTSTDNYASASESYRTLSVTSDNNKTLSQIVTTYGTGSVQTWMKDIQIEIGTPTTYAPYSNICPISGWDGVKVWRESSYTPSAEPTYQVEFPALTKNLLKTSGLSLGTPSNTSFSNTTKRTFTIGTYISGLANNNYYQSRATDISVSENSIKFTTSANAYGISIPLIGLSVGQQYTISATSSNGRVGLSFYEQDGTYISGGAASGTNNYYTTTVPVGTYYAICCFSAISSNIESTFTNIQLEQASSPSAYVPYTNTVYGGTIDVVSGELVVDRAEIDLGDIDWISQTWGFISGYAGIPNMLTYGSYFHAINWLCSEYKVGTTNSTPQSDCEVAMTINQARIRVRDDRYTGDTPANFKEAVKGVKLVYELAQPLTYQLTPTQIQTLLGDNTVWADAGSVSLTYAARRS